MEVELLHALHTREEYEKYSKYVIKKETISSEVNKILLEMGKYFKKHPEETTDRDWETCSSSTSINVPPSIQ